MNQISNNDSLKGAFIGFVIGFATGAVTAMLLTTKTGEELRSDIRKAMLDIREEVQDKADKAKNLTKKKYEDIVSNAIKNYKKVKELSQKEIDFIKKTLLEQKEAIK